MFVFRKSLSTYLLDRNHEYLLTATIRTIWPDCKRYQALLSSVFADSISLLETNQGFGTKTNSFPRQRSAAV